MKRIGISIAMAVGILAGLQIAEVDVAVAQTSTTGAVRGRIVDKATKEAVIGATVVATGPALPGQQAEITDEGGNFVIANLPPGIYTLTVYYNEAQFSRPNVLIELGKQAFVSVPIDTAVQASEVIELEGRVPIVDQGSTKVGSTIREEYTRNVPVGRTFGAVLGTAAGTQGDLYGVSFSGSTSAENTYIVEGINTTDTAYGLQSSNLPNEFIEETEVIAGGYNAEFGRSTGGVINVVTKQGSNQFHGSVFGYYTPGGLVADASPVLREGSAIGREDNLRQRLDAGFEIGGPIQKDKFWFHVGYNPSLSTTDVDRITNRLVDVMDNTTNMPVAGGDGLPDIDPDTDFTVFEEVGRNTLSDTRKTHFFTAKINGALSQDHQFQISGFGNPRFDDRALYRVLTPSARPGQLYKFDDGAYDAALKWTSKFNDNKTQIDFVAGYHLGYSHDKPFFPNGEPGGADAKALQLQWDSTLYQLRSFEPEAFQGCEDGTANDPYMQIDNCPISYASSYIINGLGFLEERDNARTSATLAVTQRVKLLGHHTFKLGADIEQTTYNSKRLYTGGGIWINRPTIEIDPDLPNNYFDTGKLVGGHWDLRSFIYPDPDGTIPCVNDETMCSYADENGIRADTSNRNLGAYLQDSWQIRPNLTVNGGLRWERQTAFTAKALQGKISPEGLIIPDEAFTLDNQIAPRIGIIYDPTQEGRAKIFGHYGRFYETVPMDINVRAFGGEIINFGRTTAFTRRDDNMNGTPEMVPGGDCPEAFNTTSQAVLDACTLTIPDRLQFGGGTELVAPSTAGQYINEVILGAEYELMPDFKMGINYVGRSLPRAIEDLSVDGGNNYIIANPGENFDDDADDYDQLSADAMAAGDDNLAELYAFYAEELRAVKNFDKPVRDYHGIQVTANQRFSKHAMLIGSYTYSRSKGNFPGLFSTETGQLDPNLTSMYDLPDLMANRYGAMAHDRPHLVKLDGFYLFDLKNAGHAILGASFRGQSGIAHNALASHWFYGSDESYLQARGSAGRSPFTWDFDVKATYGYKINKTQTVEAFIDVFNLFNNQDEIAADERYTRNNVNPIINGEQSDLDHAKALDDSGLQTNSAPVRNKNFGNLSARQSPRSVRFGLRYTF